MHKETGKYVPNTRRKTNKRKFWGLPNIVNIRERIQSRYYKYVREQKKTRLNEVKEGMMIIARQVQNMSKEKEIVKKGLNANQELTSTITEIEKLTEELNSRCKLAEEKINKDQQRLCNLRRLKKEEKATEPQRTVGSIKCSNICIMRRAVDRKNI